MCLKSLQDLVISQVTFVIPQKKCFVLKSLTPENKQTKKQTKNSKAEISPWAKSTNKS